MAKLPVVSGHKCVKALENAGFRVVRRAKNAHVYMQRDDPFAVVSVPDHKEIARGLLRAIIRDAGLTVDQFVALL